MHSEQTAPASGSVPDSTGSSSPMTAVQDPDPAHAASSEAVRTEKHYLFSDSTSREEDQRRWEALVDSGNVRAMADLLDGRPALADVPGVGTVPIDGGGKEVATADGQPFLVKECERVSVPSDTLRALIDGGKLHASIDIDELQEFTREEKLREGLVIQLLFAARDLAGRICRAVELPRRDAGAAPVLLYVCKECGRSDFRGAFGVRHTRKCPVGRVKVILADFDKLFPNHGRPEPATARPAEPDLATRPCGKCGAADGAWMTEMKPRTEVRDVDANQCVSLETADGYLIVHTHLCVDSAEPGGAA